MATKLVQVPADQLSAAWPLVTEHLAQMQRASRGKLSLDDIAGFLVAGNFNLWIVLDGSDHLATVITELIQYPQRRVCRVNCCVGEHRQKWIHLLAEIEAWGRANGCAAMEIIARKGWARVLHEYQPTHVFLERDI